MGLYQRVWVVLLSLALLSGPCFCNIVLLHDQSGRHCHEPTEASSAVPVESVAGVLASVAGLVPPYSIDADSSRHVSHLHMLRWLLHPGACMPCRSLICMGVLCMPLLGCPLMLRRACTLQVERVVRPNVFQQPKALVVFNVAGLGTGVCLDGASCSRGTRAAPHDCSPTATARPLPDPCPRLCYRQAPVLPRSARCPRGCRPPLIPRCCPLQTRARATGCSRRLALSPRAAGASPWRASTTHRSRAACCRASTTWQQPTLA